MPELPEVETIKEDLKTKVLNRTFVDLWTDTEKIIKKELPLFKTKIKKAQIKQIERKGKNIIISLSNNYYLLIHLKLTGHFLYDQRDRYTRVVFSLDNGKILSLSDLRKFAKIELLTKEELEKKLAKIGPDPLKISLREFKKAMPKRGKIKSILMNQEIISGIGNIYADEILWKSKIHPLTDISQIKNLDLILKETRNILKKAIKLRGTSVSDYKDLQGNEGSFGKERNAYRKKSCPTCQTEIKRIKLGNRSCYFCPSCQKI